MYNTFKHYNLYSKEEIDQLWANCLFVFDTNTLLNMYRYSRSTVDEYFKVLNTIKKKNQLWIPYQVGLEFYENRLKVISEYECSYDDILKIFESTKTSIKDKFKNHPFLDITKLMESLKSFENEIESVKNKHPKWMEEDDVLTMINSLFEGCVGVNFDENSLQTIYRDGAERFAKMIPPGFKDDKKTDNTKYGDLVLWKQMINKAKDSKKPIIFISGDLKEDWWLRVKGKTIMPLPQLRKEMLDEAGVEFHMYTADRFLDHHRGVGIKQTTIDEVKRIIKSEELRMIKGRRRESENLRLITGRPTARDIYLKNYSIEYIDLFDSLQDLLMEIKQSDKDNMDTDELHNIFKWLRFYREKIITGNLDERLQHKISLKLKNISFFLYNISHSANIDIDILRRLRKLVYRLDHFNIG